MDLEKFSGTCSNGKRHKWGKSFRVSKSAFFSRHISICQHSDCIRARVVEYTKRGNHVAGYRFASHDELVKARQMTDFLPPLA